MESGTATWRAHQRALLVGLARASRDPDGGFGWLDDAGTRVPGRPVEAWITCRMTHVLALAESWDGAATGDLVEHGVAALRAGGVLHDDRHGGWRAAADDPAKKAYEHAFVLLAAASALAAGHESARPVLDEAVDVLEHRFREPVTGLYRDVLAPDWTWTEDYLGANAAMHLVEAHLTAYDAGAGAWAIERALALATRVVHEVARAHDWRLPEHYNATGAVLLDLNRDDPGHPFRPYGVTIGHLLEWARLLVHLAHALGERAPGWLRTDAAALFDRAVSDGWAADGADGFVYTTDFEGHPVVRERLHWVLAEAIGAATALGRDAERERWWAHAREHVATADGSWRHELAPDLTPAATIWQGRPDVYHAYQALLLPDVLPAASFVRRA